MQGRKGDLASALRPWEAGAIVRFMEPKPLSFTEAFKIGTRGGRVSPDASFVKRVFPTRHPMVKNEDGSESNVLLTGMNHNGREYVIPTMVDGRKLTPQDAFRIAKKRGLENYPNFSSVEEADKWARENHGSIDEEGFLRKK